MINRAFVGPTLAGFCIIRPPHEYRHSAHKIGDRRTVHRENVVLTLDSQPIRAAWPSQAASSQSLASCYGFISVFKKCPCRQLKTGGVFLAADGRRLNMCEERD